MASRLERVMGNRAAKETKSLAANRKAEESKQARAQRQRRSYERKEFNRLFARLKTLVDGKWDRSGWGWSFKYKGTEYYIAYQDWFYAKTPGDVDDYDQRGTDWVLKRGFNASDELTFTLSHGERGSGLTEEVMRGLKELDQR